MKDRKQHQHVLKDWELQCVQLKKSLRWDTRPWYLILGESDFASAGLVSIRDEGVFLAPEETIWRDQATELKESKWQSWCRQIRRTQCFLSHRAVIIGYSLELLQDPVRLKAFNQDVTRALQTCYAYSWGAIPLYVTITGIEGVPGFAAYFKRLKPAQKEQVLGFNDALSLPDSFKALHQRLSARVLSHLNWEALSVEDNAALLFFPQALAEYYPKLEASLHDRRLLRGVYFTTETSVKQIEIDVLAKEVHYFKPWNAVPHFLEAQRKKIVALALAGLLLVFGIWWLGVLKAEDYLAAINQNLNISALRSDDPMVYLPALENLNQVGVQDDRWFGRYLGMVFPNKIKEALQDQYNLALRKQFEPFLVGELEQNLQNSLAISRSKNQKSIDLLTQDAAIYNSLSAYLMLNDLDHFDAHSVAGQIAEPAMLPVYWDWVNLGVEAMPINMDLVGQARAILGNQPLAIQAFFALKESANEVPTYLAGQGQTSFVLSQGASVDGFFTQAAANQYLNTDEAHSVMQTLNQSWVLGASQAIQVSHAAIQAVSAQVTQFYWSQYTAAWMQALSGVSLKPFANIEAAASWFNAAGHADSDWMTLWQQMAQNLPALQGYFSANSNLTGIQTALLAVGAGLSQAHTGNDSLNMAIQILNGQFAPLNQLQALSAAAPQPVQSILQSVVRAATKTVFNQAEKQVSANWQGQVAGACRQVIQQTNPDLNVFSHFFNRDGVGGRFMNQHMAALVNIKNGQLEERSAYGVPFILPNFLQQDIVRLMLIHDAFFHQNNAPSLNINLTPMVLSKNLAEFSMTNGAQTLFYQNGPRFTSLWHWPSPNHADVVIKFVSLDGTVQTETYSGVWALIQLFNSASVTTIDRTHFALTFSKGDASASYELFLAQGNFAGVLALQGFDCQ